LNSNGNKSSAEKGRGTSTKLDSWKEIASYLRREVRTVQRWEKGEGLPVRRLLHEKRGSVYAYSNELDAWTASRNPEPAMSNSEPDQSRPRWASYGPATAAVCLLAALLLVVTRSSGRMGTGGSSGTVHASAASPGREAFLRGQYYFNRGTLADIQASIGYFQKAVAADPSHAAAFANLSKAYLYLGSGTKEAPTDIPLAIEAAERAVSLDRSLAAAYEARALVRAYGSWDWKGAREDFDRALSLNESLASLHSSYAQFEALLGRQDVAIAEAKRARELEPLSAIVGSDLAWYYYWARRYEEALEVSREVLANEPQFFSARHCIVRCLRAQERFEELRAELKRQLVQAGKDPVKFGLDATPAEAAVHEYYVRSLETLEQAHAEKDTPLFDIAIALAALGRRDDLLKCLENAYERHEIIVMVMNVEPLFDPYREEPRFREIQRKVGLPAPEYSRNGVAPAESGAMRPTRVKLTQGK
jgi:tetratricopeptide (TPR) repeat protein